jgi:hypothetical protein
MRAGWISALMMLLAASAPLPAAAWGYEGHRVAAAIARAYLNPAARAKVDALLAADTDPTEAHDMLSAATWADTWRNSHRETAAWHFVDLELGRPDMASACFGFPAPLKPASAGPAQDCLVDRLNAFLDELAAPATDPAERIVALKYVLHFVGDIHQPLHASDNADRGGNCVLLALGGPRSVNLHSFWDTGLIEAMGADPEAIANDLRARITPAQKTAWEAGDPKAWALESFGVAKADVYRLGSKPGCDDKSPVAVPPGYEAAARQVAAVQLERAGVRLAWVLNRTLGGAR